MPLLLPFLLALSQRWKESNLVMDELELTGELGVPGDNLLVCSEEPHPYSLASLTLIEGLHLSEYPAPTVSGLLFDDLGEEQNQSCVANWLPNSPSAGDFREHARQKTGQIQLQAGVRSRPWPRSRRAAAWLQVSVAHWGLLGSGQTQH